MNQNTNKITLSFTYLGDFYTAYVDVDSEQIQMVKHDSDDLNNMLIIGQTTVDKLIGFFSRLPRIEDIID